MTNALILAARPKTLTAGVIPIIVGTALAPEIHWGYAISAFLFALFTQVGINYTNDAIDFNRGADTAKRLGPTRVVASGLLDYSQVMRAAWVSFSLAILAAVPLMVDGGFGITLLLLSCVIFGYGYTGGPYPLAYHGMGELFVILYFGLAAVGVSSFMQLQEVTVGSLILGLQLGCLATVLICINNLRDYEEDRMSGKKTLAVRFGKPFARLEIAFFAIAPFVMNFYWLGRGMKWAGFFPFILLPLAMHIVRSIQRTEPSRAYNQFLAFSALLHLGFGALLTLGLRV